MTREQVAAKAKLLQVYADGGTVQILSGVGKVHWEDVVNPMFNSDIDRYRIKPQEPRKFFVWEKNGCTSATVLSDPCIESFELDGWTKIPVTEDIS